MATLASSDLGPELDKLVDQIISSYENNDADSYRKVFAPGAAVWLSYLNGEMSAEQNADLLTQIFATFVGAFHYDNMRRQKTATGYVQQCDLTIVAKDGATFTTTNCTVATVNENGLVTRLEEYLDSGMIAFSEKAAGSSTSAPSPA